MYDKKSIIHFVFTSVDILYSSVEIDGCHFTIGIFDAKCFNS